MQQRLDRISEAFLAAPLEPDGWDRALRLMAEGTGAAHGQLVAFGNDATLPFNHVTGVDDDWARRFAATDGANPALNWRLPCSLPPLEVASERHYDVVRPRFRGNAYDAFAIDNDMENGCQAVLARTPEAFFGIATLRNRREGRTSDAQLAFFASAAATALTGVRMQMALQSQADALVMRTLERMDATAFVIDRHARLIDRTPAAERLLSASGFLTVSGGVLQACRTADQAAFLKALRRVADALRPGDERAALWLGATGAGGGRRCEIFRLPAQDYAFTTRPSFVVVVRSPPGADNAAAALLRQAFNLTAAEAEVAMLLAQGHAREAVAGRRGISQHTVHTQIRSIFDKTGVTREGALVALIGRVLG